MNIMMVKAIGEVVISIGVGTIIGNVIKATTPTNIGIAKKICIGVGALALESMFANAVSTYVEKALGGVFAEVEKKNNARYEKKIYDLCEEEIHRM